MDISHELAQREQQFNALVDTFVNNFSTKVAAQAFKLGKLFDAKEYPSANDMHRKFGFRYHFTPVPESGDFRVDIGNDAMNDLKDQYDRLYQSNLDKVNADAWDRLYKVLTQLSFGLRTDENGKQGKIYSSVVDNAKDLCDLLQHFNVSGDTQLEAMRIKLEDTITGIDAKDIKDSDYVRVTVKKTVDSMLDGIGDRTNNILDKF
jgi:hypothetical protein